MDMQVTSRFRGSSAVSSANGHLLIVPNRLPPELALLPARSWSEARFLAVAGKEN